MQTPPAGAAPCPLAIVNPRAGRGRPGRGFAPLLGALRAAVGELDAAETRYAGHAVALAAGAPATRLRAGRPADLAPAGRPAGRRLRAGLFPLDVDGDALGDIPLSVEVVPGALRVCAPRA